MLGATGAIARLPVVLSYNFPMRSGIRRCFAMGFLVGCYSPTFPEHQPCSESQSCPGDQTCDVATNECVTEVPEAAHFVQIANNHRHVCGIDDAGRLWCWGRNDRGQLGLG